MGASHQPRVDVVLAKCRLPYGEQRAGVSRVLELRVQREVAIGTASLSGQECWMADASVDWSSKIPEWATYCCCSFHCA